ncbi:hypothetical protein ACIBKY_26215 [Nonomuraea sp. NPDC050394]|uniref:hypothetical protein n=1 Tax=Nonomuraea sp. NPDC050394 TaxID=3364363 RepID=UPI003790E191
MNDTLAGFEQRRLAELKAHVATRAATERDRRPRRRLALATAAGAAIATVAAVATVATPGGPDTAYAVTKDADGIVHVTVRDFRDAPGLSRQLAGLGVPAIVDYVPAGQKCRDERGTPVTDIPRGLYYAPTSIPGEPQAWRMQINTKLFKPGQTFVWTLAVAPVDGYISTSTILTHNPVAPCVLVPDDRRHRVQSNSPAPATSLKGYPAEGKTVGEVRAEIVKRGLAVTYLVTEPHLATDDRFAELERNFPYDMYPNKQDTPVGDDWFVWRADEPEPGTIRLAVTRKLKEDAARSSS